MAKKRASAYIVDGLRTPIGKAGGVFAQQRPDDLLAHVISAMMAKYPHISAESIDDVIIGCAMPEAEQGMNVARISLLLAGLPASVPGMTINRFCASGLQTVALAAERVALGKSAALLAGGVESMSMVPIGGHKLTNNPKLFSGAEDLLTIAYSMGITAEKVADCWQISRTQQDEFALESHHRAIKAMNSGEFNDEITPYERVSQYPDLLTRKIVSQKVTIGQDEGPRRDSNADKLAGLKPVFMRNGCVTAGNSSQMSDGAAILLVASAEFCERHRLEPIAELISYEVAGVAPEYMGIGPVRAIPKALRQANLSLDQLDWIELNEAFAAQTLAVIKELGLDKNKVNPLGGAIALGHPLGATGAVRAVTLLHGLRRHGLDYGMVTMCIGTGMGAAGVFRAL